jgi:hypothetical protein
MRLNAASVGEGGVTVFDLGRWVVETGLPEARMVESVDSFRKPPPVTDVEGWLAVETFRAPSETSRSPPIPNSLTDSLSMALNRTGK